MGLTSIELNINGVCKLNWNVKELHADLDSIHSGL
jgi:hypothetical protein